MVCQVEEEQSWKFSFKACKLNLNNSIANKDCLQLLSKICDVILDKNNEDILEYRGIDYRNFLLYSFLDRDSEQSLVVDDRCLNILLRDIEGTNENNVLS